MEGANMSRLIIGIMAATMLTSSANAAEWGLVASRTSGDRLYVDADSIARRASNIREAWVKTSLQQPWKDGTFKLLDHWRFDCAERKIALLRSMTYDSSDQISLDMTLVPTEIRAVEVVPDTPGEKLLKFACAH